MSVTDSLIVSAFGISIVFLALVLLSLFVKIQSYIIKTFIPDKKTDLNKKGNISKTPVANNEKEFSAGELKLINVDEKTAAMIMAIVSDETKIPLSELRFKTIKAID